MAEYAGIGTLIKRGDGASPEVFTTIAQVGDIDGPKLKAGTYDVTTHDNTLAGYKDFITGLKDGQEIKCKLFFDATAATHKDASGGILNDFIHAAVHSAGRSGVDHAAQQSAADAKADQRQDDLAARPA